MPRSWTLPAFRAASVLTLVWFAHDPVQAGPAQLCLDAAAATAEDYDIPQDVLLAITLVETGRADQPWPWTVAVEGTGHWLESADAAATLIDAAIADGLTKIDIGCFQLNYRWHGAAFASATEMLDPLRNAQYAAQFLSEHQARTGDWSSAAAAYHSATPEHAKVYQARFDARLAGLGTGAAKDRQDRAADLPNRFPLLVKGAAGAHGSLVPTGAGGQRLIGGQ